MGTAEKEIKERLYALGADLCGYGKASYPCGTHKDERCGEGQKNGEMEKYCFRKTCGPGGGAWYNRQKYPAAYPGIWEYGLAQFDIDGTCAGSGGAEGGYLQQLRQMRGNLSGQRIGKPGNLQKRFKNLFMIAP